MSDEKKGHQKFCLYIQNGGDDIQKWVNLSTLWKILALGSIGLGFLLGQFEHLHACMQVFNCTF